MQLNYHSPDVYPYLVAIWGLILVNALFRSISTRRTTAYIVALPGAESTIITYPRLSRGFTPCQHVRLRLAVQIPVPVPAPLPFLSGKHTLAALLESHPFTIASANESGQPLQLLVRKAGDWTAGLYEMASTATTADGLAVKCWIEGPYGERPRSPDPDGRTMLMV